MVARMPTMVGSLLKAVLAFSLMVLLYNFPGIALWLPVYLFG